MVPFNNEGKRIVRSYPGTGTMDTILETENGERWIHSPNNYFDDSATVSPRRGRIIGNRVYG